MRAVPSVTVTTGTSGSGWIGTAFAIDANYNSLKIWSNVYQTSTVHIVTLR